MCVCVRARACVCVRTCVRASKRACVCMCWCGWMAGRGYIKFYNISSNTATDIQISEETTTTTKPGVANGVGWGGVRDISTKRQR